MQTHIIEHSLFILSQIHIIVSDIINNQLIKTRVVDDINIFCEDDIRYVVNYVYVACRFDSKKSYKLPKTLKKFIIKLFKNDPIAIEQLIATISQIRIRIWTQHMNKSIAAYAA